MNKSWLLDLVYRPKGAEKAPLPVAHSTRQQIWAVGLICWALLTLLYVLTVSPSIGMCHDTGELTTCCVIQGVPHSPGYPLFVAIGWLASLLPFGEPAYNLNLLSAVELGCAMGFLGAGLALASRPWPALIATLMAGTCTAIWRQGVVTEVFALHLFLLCLLTWLAVLWEFSEDVRRREIVLVTSFVLGCCLAHQHIIALAAPAFLFFGSTAKGKGRAWGFSWLNIPVFLAAVALPYALQSYFASQKPMLNWGNVVTFENLKNHFLRKAYGTGLLNEAAQQYDARAGDGQVTAYFISLARSYFPFPSLLFPLLALDRLVKQRFQPRFWLYFGLAVLYGPIFAVLGNQPGQEFYSDMMERFYSSSMIGVAGLAAFGIEWLVYQLWTPALRYVPMLLLVPLYNGWLNYPKCSQRSQYQGIDTVRAMFKILPPRSAIIMNGDLPAGVADYLRYVLGERRDLIVILPGLASADWYQERLPVGLALAASKVPKDVTATHEMAMQNMLEYLDKRGFQVWANQMPPKVKGVYTKCGLLYRWFPSQERAWTTDQRNAEFHRVFRVMEASPRRGNFQLDWRQNFWIRFCILEWIAGYREIAKVLAESDPETACKAMDRVIEMEYPATAESYLNRAALQLRLSRYEQAIKDYKICLLMVPNSRLALQGMVMAQQGAGHADEAKAYQRKLDAVQE